MVIKNLAPMVEAQMSNARGLKYLAYRDRANGKWMRVTPELLDTLPEGAIVEVFAKEPCVPAFADLLNRTLDRPAEHVEVSGADGSPLVIRWQGE
jgi:hypothetical protein